MLRAYFRVGEIILFHSDENIGVWIEPTHIKKIMMSVPRTYSALQNV